MSYLYTYRRHPNEIEVACMCAAMLLFGFVAGSAIMASLDRREAIKHGAAHWTIDQDGNPTFRWNDEVKP
jgi:hypothetical protein